MIFKLKMKYIALVIVLVLTVLGYAFFRNQSTPAQKTEAFPTEQIEQAEKPKPEIEVVASGIKRPHGIGVYKDTIYVSSETDKALYKVIDGKVEKFLNLNFPHDMIFQDDGSIITPVFNENRLVKIYPDGKLEDLSKNLSGPNGLAKITGGCFLVTSYISGDLDCINEDGKTTHLKNLKGPAGVIVKGSAVYVAVYNAGTILKYSLITQTTNFIPQVLIKDLSHPESIGIINNRLFTTHSVEGKGVVSEILDSAELKTILETDLPDPLVGHFTEDGFVYLVSPNDPQGRILKAKIN